MTAQLATLIAAVFAAVAALFSAFLSSRTARRIAEETAHAQSQRELSAFRRDHLVRIKETILESAVVLQTLRDCCFHVPWLAQAPLADIQERASTAISRLSYAAEELKAMKAVEPARLVAASGLSYPFMLFMGKIWAYREQVDAGNIALSGEAKEAARAAEANVIDAHKSWQERLDQLRCLTAELRASL